MFMTIYVKGEVDEMKGRGKQINEQFSRINELKNV